MADEIQRVTSKVGSTPTAPTEGVWRLAFGSDTTTDLDFDATVGAIQAALEALSAIGSGNIAANGDLVTGPNYYSTLTFQGALANSNVASIVTYADTLKATDGSFNPTATVTTQGVTAQNEIQRFDFNDVTSGQCTITWSIGAVTFNYESNSASNIQASVDNALGAGRLVVTEDTPNLKYNFEFVGEYAATNIALGEATAVDGGSPIMTGVQDGVAGVVEVWSIDLDDPTSGDWGLGSGASLAYDCVAADVETYIETQTSLGWNVTGSAGSFTATRDEAGAVSDPSFEIGTLEKKPPITLGLTVVQEGGSVAPVVNLTASTTSIVENGGVAYVSALLTATASATVTVVLSLSGTATNNTDYTASGTTISITSGNTSGSQSITALADTTYEGNETVVVDIASVSGGGATENGTQQVTITIVDDDSAPTVTLAVSDNEISENGGSSIVRALLSNPSATNCIVTLAFSGTAVKDTDYSASSTSILVSAGQTSGSITVDTLDDATFEGDETIIIDVSSVSGGTENGTQQQTITIVEDELPAAGALLLLGVG